MTPGLEIPFPDLLSVIFGFLIRPLHRSEIETSCRESPTVRGKVLALVGPRFVGAMF